MNRVLRKGMHAALATLVGFATAQGVHAAEYKLLVEPSYNVQRATEVYQPLADYLSKATGHKITLVTSRNYHFFWRDVRQNAPIDFMFSEAHFTDFRAKRFQFEPIARTVENTSYTLLGSDQLTNTTLNGLIGKGIVTMPSPSMGFAMLLQFFPDPVRQPNMMSTAQSWQDGVEIVFAGEADAAIECINCGVCYASCDTVKWDKDYLGPAQLNRAWTLVNDVRDGAQLERLAAVSGDAGCQVEDLTIRVLASCRGPEPLRERTGAEPDYASGVHRLQRGQQPTLSRISGCWRDL